MGDGENRGGSVIGDSTYTTYSYQGVHFKNVKYDITTEQEYLTLRL